MEKDFPDFDFDKPYGWLDGAPYYLSKDEITEIEERKARAARQLAIDEISRLEGLVTPRRLREHILGIGTDFIPNIEALIEQQRQIAR